MITSNVTCSIGFVHVPFIALIIALVGTMLSLSNVCPASNDIKLWLMPRSTNDSKSNVVSAVILKIKGIQASSICGSSSPKSSSSRVPLYKVILLDFSFSSLSLLLLGKLVIVPVFLLSLSSDCYGWFVVFARSKACRTF